LSGVNIGPHGKAEICPSKLRPIADILAGSLNAQALEDSQYLSVETIISRSADMSAQLYALGVLAYRLYTGSYPFKADSLEEMVAVKISFDVPPLSQVRPGVNK